MRKEAMGLRYENLDATTRPLMLEEIERDGDKIYISNYLNDEGRERWPEFLREAARNGTDNSLAEALRVGRCFKRQVVRRKPKGGFTMAAVPVTAAQTLAESQFNMYYMRALARRAIDGKLALIVYRAKAVDNPRLESERMIDTQLDPAEVLRVLRDTHGVEPSIGIPLPNTGLTVKLGDG